jgi:hypothetical protein
MKLHRILSLTVIVLIGEMASGAGAATFDFSYTFVDQPNPNQYGNALNNGAVITGSFTGTQSGNLITGIGDVSASISNFNGTVGGVSMGTPLYVFSYTGAYGANCGTCYTAGGATVSVDGSQSNFSFANAPVLASATKYFYVIPGWLNPGQTIAAQYGDLTVPGSPAYADFYNGQYAPQNWKVWAAPVPAALPLFGAALAGFGGFGWWRRRRAA